jgi:hypothetical protein
MQETTCVAIALSHLESILQPDIPLPLACADEVDRDRVFFGVRYYVYASIAHVRKVLRGLAYVADDANKTGSRSRTCDRLLARVLNQPNLSMMSGSR